MRKNFLFPLIFFFVFLAGCHKKNRWNPDVSKIPAEIEIVRFDTMFYGASPYRLPALKKQFPYLFDPSVPDSLWLKKMQDSLLLDLKTQTDSVFADMTPVKKKLENLYKHIKYYFPKIKAPKTITLFSDWDYLKRIYLTDTLAFLFIDNYLGENNRIYNSIPQYIRHNMNPEHIPVDWAERFAQRLIPAPKTGTLLEKMIHHGKILFLQKVLLPSVADSVIIGYTSEKWQWAKDNEADVWLYFLDNKLLFSTDPKLDSRFIDLAPFSKFYTGVDNESAGMIGRYIGWQIVKKYMDKTGTDIQSMLRTPAEQLFRQSKYKPR